MKIALFGLGYVGTVTAACLARAGHTVVGVDPDLAKVELVAGGRSPIVERGLDELVASEVAAGRLSATTAPAGAVQGADVVLVCVGTPSLPNGGPDLAAVQRAGTDIGTALAGSQHPVTVVLRSTVPPGTLETVLGPAVAAAAGRPATASPSTGRPDEIGLALCPEFLREGTSIEDFVEPPFTAVGTAHEPSIERLRELFAFIDRPFHVLPTRSAEGLKYACNAFHALKVSFANELSRVFRHVGVDSREVMRLFVEDDRLNISPAYLRPGFAFGGSCLPKDLRTLLWLGRREGVELPVLHGTMATNQAMIADAVEVLQRSTARTVTLVGLSFKPHTDDLRESPYVELAERLVGKGYDLRIHDPIVQPDRLVGANKRFVEQRLPHLHRLLHTDLGTALHGADAVVVAARSAELELLLADVKPPLVLDLSGRMGAAVETLPGYVGIGW